MIRLRGLLEKLWRYCRALFFSKKKFIPPPQSKVLIYDAGGSKHLLRNLNIGKAEILYARGEKLNLAVLLKAVFNKGRLRDSYEDCYIHFVNPSVVITAVDNSPQFYMLSRN